MMNDHRHPDEADISAYLDGELDSRQQQRISSHLQSCPACHEEMDKLTALFHHLETLPEAAAQKDLSPGVLAVLRGRNADASAPVGRSTRTPPWRRLLSGRQGWIAVPQVLLTALLLGLFGAPLWQIWLDWLAALYALVAEQHFVAPWSGLAGWISIQWLAFLQAWEQPLPLAIPTQQAMIILAVAGLAWLIGSRLLLGTPDQRI